jgi:hypothetical protein
MPLTYRQLEIVFGPLETVSHNADVWLAGRNEWISATCGCSFKTEDLELYRLHIACSAKHHSLFLGANWAANVQQDETTREF